jgi:hypothetical protein
MPSRSNDLTDHLVRNLESIFGTRLTHVLTTIKNRIVVAFRRFYLDLTHCFAIDPTEY